VFTGSPGKYVSLKDTIKGFKMIVSGEWTPAGTGLLHGRRHRRGHRKGEEAVYVSGGMLEVQPDMITVLADTAIRAHDLDEAKALEAKKRAEEALANRNAEMDYAAAEAELAQAVAQLQAIQRLRKHTH
jgi:ATP synthase F1 epsilon subunit